MNKFLWLIFVAIGVIIYKMPTYNIQFFTTPNIEGIPVSLGPCLALIGLIGLIKSALSRSS